MDERISKRPYFNQKYIKEILDLHMSGKKNYSDLIGRLMTFEFWNRIFIDNFWANPTGIGFSQTCSDVNKDGICDTSYTLASGNVDYLPTCTISGRVSTK
jgi:hypothetical protein